MTDMEMYESVDDILESQDKTKPSSNEYYETLHQTHQKKASTCSFSTTACRYSCLLLLVVASTSLSIATFVLYTTDESIDGSWSSWANWEACSTTCDTGMQKRGRNCSNPAPRGTGRQCLGTDIEVRLCQSEPCRMEQTSTKGPSENVVDTNIAFNVFNATHIANNIIFSSVLLNEGSAYNKSNGIFTAPFTGLYIFIGHVCVDVSNDADYALKVEGKSVASGEFRTPSDADDGKCTSFSAVAAVQKEEKVWIECKYLVQSSNDWNSFSGILIHKT